MAETEFIEESQIVEASKNEGNSASEESEEKEPDTSLTLTSMAPVTILGQEVTQFICRRLSFWDLVISERIMNQTRLTMANGQGLSQALDFEEFMYQFSYSTGHTIADLEKISASDALAFQVEFELWLRRGHAQKGIGECTLSRPLVYDVMENGNNEAKTIPTLKFKTLSSGDIIASEHKMGQGRNVIAKPGEIELTFYQMSQSTGIPAEELGKIDSADAIAATNVFLPFLFNRQAKT